ncbi:PqqD family protein [Streptomyces sp. NPDC051211]|uniref:PqqD family protein n=1 Tax=Streptomyces sp. NPDC051211 TaxID=3154643 RepID=UPI00344E7187
MTATAQHPQQAGHAHHAQDVHHAQDAHDAHDAERFRRTLRTRVRRVGGVLHLSLDDRDLVLDDTAELLWHRLAAPVTLADLTETVAAEYGISPDEVRDDVAEAVAGLVAEGFVRQRCRP